MNLFTAGLTAEKCRKLVLSGLKNGWLTKPSETPVQPPEEAPPTDKPCNVRNMEAMIRARDVRYSIRKKKPIEPGMMSIRARDIGISMADYQERLKVARRRMKNGESYKTGWV
jgi:hypothetical protein